MKKSYIQPSIVLVETDTESLLAEVSSISIDNNNTYEAKDALSKTLHNSSLWDSSWEEEEDE